MAKGSLTPRQRRFVQEYLVDLNGKQAAIRAGCKETSAEVTASKWLRLDKVRKAVDAAQKRAADRAEVRTGEVLQELMRVGFADPAAAIDPKTGKLLALHDMPVAVRRAIAGIETEELFVGRGEDREHVGTLVKVKFWDKPKSLELLGKYRKLFTDKVEHEVGKSLEDIIRASMQEPKP